MRKLALALAAVGAVLAGAHGAVAQTQPAAVAAATGPARAPLDLFVGFDNFRSPAISRNGRYIATVHREAVGDVLTVIDTQNDHVSRVSVARADQLMQIDDVQFKGDDRLVFQLTQKVHVVAGRNSAVQRAHVDDAWEFDSRIYSSNLEGGDLKALYDPSTQQGYPRWLSAGIVSILPADDDNVLLGAPAEGGEQLWKVNVRTGEHTVMESGNLYTGGWIVDSQGVPVLRIDSVANGRGYAWLRRGPGQRSWTEITRFIGADGANSAPTFRGIGAATAPGQVFVSARRDGQNTNGIYIYDTATGQYVQDVETNTNYDVVDAIRDPHNNTVLAACYLAERWTCDPKDATFAHSWNSIVHALGTDKNVYFLDRGGPDNSRWLIETNGPQDLGSFYLYDANAHSLNLLFGARPVVDAALLPTQRIVHYTTSDGQQQWGYLMIPPGVRDVRNLPLVVMPHGGPEGRDSWGDVIAMPFATQGYAVFQPNFRGGGGFGRAFVESGWHQWGSRMQDDVSDGVKALISQGLVDAHRICIWGWSYGGYVAETAAFENTDLYKCSVAGAGISDMSAMLRWVRDGQTRDDVQTTGGMGSQSSSYKYWTDAMGDLDRDHAYLVAHSAAENAARVGMPLLLIHGDEDFTVPFEQSEIMQRAMQRAGHPVRLVTLAGANHYYMPDAGDAWRTAFTESLNFIQQNIGPGVAAGSQ